jgi:hypothetical protein
VARAVLGTDLEDHRQAQAGPFERGTDRLEGERVPVDLDVVEDVRADDLGRLVPEQVEARVGAEGDDAGRVDDDHHHRGTIDQARAGRPGSRPLRARVLLCPGGCRTRHGARPGGEHRAARIRGPLGVARSVPTRPTDDRRGRPGPRRAARPRRPHWSDGLGPRADPESGGPPRTPVADVRPSPVWSSVEAAADPPTPSACGPTCATSSRSSASAASGEPGSRAAIAAPDRRRRRRGRRPACWALDEREVPIRRLLVCVAS